MMTPRERLLAPFHDVKPDRPAWQADLSYWYSAAKAADKLQPQYRGRDGYKRLHEDLGICFYHNISPCVFEESFVNIEHSVKEAGNERRGYWRSPAGELTDHWQYLGKSFCWAHDEYAVKTTDDLKTLADLYLHIRYKPAYEEFNREAEWSGDSGLPVVPAPRSPLPALLADWCGVEQTIYFLADNPDLVAEVLERIDRSNDEAFDLLCAAPCELIHFGDNLDSSSSTSFFEEHMKAYYEKRLKQLHKAGKFAVVHLDGRVRGLLPKLAACGFDGIESITPAPVGDVAIEDLRAVAANSKTILWGGIPGAMFCYPWRAEDIRAHTDRLLNALACDGRLIVGSADQVPPDGCLDFCRLIAETIAAWKP